MKILQKLTAHELLNRLSDYKKKGNSFRFRCPAHQGNGYNASLKIYSDGGFSCTCFSRGCSHQAIVDAVTANDFQPPIDKPSPTKKSKCTYKGKPFWERQIEEIYRYTDENGTEIYQKVRFKQWDKNNPKYIIRRQVGHNRFKWSIGKDTPRVIYNLPNIVSAETVYIVEGEKDADNLIKLGLTATTNFDGAGRWHRCYTKRLKGKNIVIIPDNDEIGVKHGEDIIKALRGNVESIKVVHLPNLKPKQDVSDWLELGNGLNELLAVVNLTEIRYQKSAYPKMPSCTCGKCAKRASVTFRSNSEVSINPWSNGSASKCERVAHGQMIRFCKQIEEEALTDNIYLQTVSYTNYQKLRSKWNTQRGRKTSNIRYKPIHQQDGSVILISTDPDNGEKVPTNKAKLYEVVKGIFENEEREKRNRGTKDFGRNYQGTRGDGRAKQRKREGKPTSCVQFLIKNKTPKQMSIVLGIQINENDYGCAMIDQVMAVENMVNADCDLIVRKKHRMPGVSHVEMIMLLTGLITREDIGGVTDKTQVNNSNGEYLCTIGHKEAFQLQNDKLDCFQTNDSDSLCT